MSSLPFRPYEEGAEPAPGSVPVTAIVLAKDEAVNIVRCVRSLAWCEQVLVMDSGSSDDTVELARVAGAEVVHQPWLGYAGQREFALRHPVVRNDWVYFVDADEWVSAALAREVASALPQEQFVAFSQRFRLVFLGRWIRHCGWYGGSWIIRLGRRDALSYDASTPLGERANVVGNVKRLRFDLVDEDRKGFPNWLRKHIAYAEAESLRRVERSGGLVDRLRAARAVKTTRPWKRTVAKDVIFPSVPAKPVALFCYMYLLRGGWRDGRQGLIFCLMRSWYEMVIQELARKSGGSRTMRI
jgi:glycosyltransferase involved in cell wall biosynthesis